MKNRDFDKIIPRHGTSSVKWDSFNQDELPFWIADMDFMAPKPVLDTLRDAVDHGIFGYTFAPGELCELIVDKMQKDYQWNISVEDLIWLPSLVSGINVSARVACSSPNDRYIVFAPAYPPFLEASKWGGFTVDTIDMVNNDGCWEIDFDKLEESISPESKFLLFCNPHNPIGKVYRRDELEKIVDFCEKHDLIICSDEIHCELILDSDKPHIPIASISAKAAARTITLQAPSKTYNISGLACSFAIITDPELHKKFTMTMGGIISHVNQLGYNAALAAYRDCDTWRMELIDYLRGNRDYFFNEIEKITPLTIIKPEATYFAWFDCRKLPVDNPFDLFLAHKLRLTDGAEFGQPGFIRVNLGCPREMLEKCVEIIKRAVESVV